MGVGGGGDIKGAQNNGHYIGHQGSEMRPITWNVNTAQFVSKGSACFMRPGQSVQLQPVAYLIDNRPYLTIPHPAQPGLAQPGLAWPGQL